MVPEVRRREQLQAEVLAHTATAAERDRLQRRVVWLRIAYNLLHRRRRACQWIIRDVYASRLRIKAERNRLSDELEDLRAHAEEGAHALAHVVDCPVACAQCKKVANSALNHDNVDDFRSGN